MPNQGSPYLRGGGGNVLPAIKFSPEAPREGCGVIATLAMVPSTADVKYTERNLGAPLSASTWQRGPQERWGGFEGRSIL